MDTPPGEPRKLMKRHEILGHARFLTCSCYGRQPLLRGVRSPRWFLDALAAARERFGFDLWAHVVMPEHIHLLILPDSDHTVSRVLYAIKKAVTNNACWYAREFKPTSLTRMRHVTAGGKESYRFWQPGGGYDRNIWTAQELHEKVHYIHANPVRRKLVTSPGQWRWSSWRAWEEGIDAPVPIDRESFPPLLV